VAWFGVSSLFANASAAVVIDFQTGAAGAGGTITEAGGEVTGTDINISLLLVDGFGGAPDGSYVADALLQFDTALNSISITVTVDPFVPASEVLLSGSFDTFTYSVETIQGVGEMEVFSGSGPDIKSATLLEALGLAPSTPFQFFGFSIESVNGTVISTDIVNTAVPVPAAVWLFGTGLVGLVAVARRRG
jgi:hypothetical protein